MAGSDWMMKFGDVVARLPNAPETMRFQYALRHGTMRIGVYAPVGADRQGPHRQDEVYVVASGSGIFVKNGARRAFGARDAIFVEAGVEHWFEDFTEDFSAWVIFWGRDGGEADG